MATQTISTRQSMDRDTGGFVVVTGSAIIANFDRLGVLFTLSGQKAASGINPATDGYRDGGLDTTTLRIDSGTAAYSR